jgi:hypothetical protein
MWLVARYTRGSGTSGQLGCVQHALPEEGNAGPPIALTLEALQPMDLAFGDAVVPRQREPSLHGGQVVLQPTREPSHLLDPAGGRLRHPCVQVMAPALPDHGQKGLDERMGSRDACLHLTALVEIPLCVVRPMSRRAHHDERHRTGRRSLRVGRRRAL